MNGQEPVDLSDLIKEMCERLGVEPSYTYRIDLSTGHWRSSGPIATIYCFKGKDGFCQGKKYVELEREPFIGEAALEPPLTMRVIL